LFRVFSASKPIAASAVHLLAQRGQLDLDDPVVKWWPQFGHNGKSGVTVRRVLQHRSGLPVARTVVGDALAVTLDDWGRSVRNLEQARPRWPPGQVPAYGLVSYGFILGEVLQRVTGTKVSDFVHDELFAPSAWTAST
jgi:CubicO group peptidase (beta-lactamase class C family)